jgi:hypothetical protein
MVNFKFDKFHCYQQTQSFLITPYNGMQALILKKNNLSVFISCCGHSLNLVGKAAANSCACAVHFFDFVQNLYVFFTETTERYTGCPITYDKHENDFKTKLYLYEGIIDA